MNVKTTRNFMLGIILLNLCLIVLVASVLFGAKFGEEVKSYYNSVKGILSEPGILLGNGSANEKDEMMMRLVALEKHHLPFLTEIFGKLVSRIRSDERRCNLSAKILKEFDLGISVIGKRKVIRKDALTSALNISADHELINVFPSERLLSTNLQSYASLRFETSSNDFTITVNDSTLWKAKPLDILILLKDPLTNQKCYQDVRLFFGENFKIPDGFKVISSLGVKGGNNVIGGVKQPYGSEIFQQQLWTTDCVNGTIQVFKFNGDLIDTIGRYGTQSGQFHTPADMKIYKQDLYVIEENNHRLQKISLIDDEVTVFGAFGEAKKYTDSVNKFKDPLGISVSPTTILVVDYGNNRLLAFDHLFQFKWALGNSEGETLFNGPYYAEFIRSKKMFAITNRGANTIVLVDENGELHSEFGSGTLDFPHEIAVFENSDIAVANTYDNSIIIFTASSDYKETKSISFPENYGYPKTVAVSDDGRIFVGFVSNEGSFILQIQDEGRQLATPKRPHYPHLDLGQVGRRVQVQNATGSKIDRYNEIYQEYCASCHEAGKYGAPSTGMIESWAPFPRDLDQLTLAAMNGKGAMIARGGCDECSYDDIYNVIKLMVPMTWKTR